MIWEVCGPENTSILPLWSIKSYLKSHGWVYDGIWGDRGAIHAMEHGGQVWEVLVPLNDTVSDYLDVSARIVSVLSEIEERSEFDVFSELVATGSDVIRIGSTNGHIAGALSIHDSSGLYSDAHDLLAQAARAAEQPKAAYLGRYSDNVRNYLDSVVPLTEHFGGYALSLHSPVEPIIGEQPALEDTDYGSFARKTTSKLASAVGSADSIVNHIYSLDRAPDDYEDAVAAGVSANLCECIASLAESGNGIDISVHWAATRPVEHFGRPIRFTRNTVGILKQVADDIRTKQPSYDEYLEGYVVGDVVQLSREPHQFDGKATILAELNGHVIPMNVTFPEGDYSTVIDAFARRMRISVRGDVHRSGGSYELRSPRSLMPVSQH